MKIVLIVVLVAVLLVAAVPVAAERPDQCSVYNHKGTIGLNVPRPAAEHSPAFEPFCLPLQ